MSPLLGMSGSSSCRLAAVRGLGGAPSAGRSPTTSAATCSSPTPDGPAHHTPSTTTNAGAKPNGCCTMPWDPTNERLDWLAELTAGSGVPTRWMGRTNLDVLAAQRQSLVSYYYGDGGQQLQR